MLGDFALFLSITQWGIMLYRFQDLPSPDFIRERGFGWRDREPEFAADGNGKGLPVPYLRAMPEFVKPYPRGC
jgi:hypothetical protein